MSRPETVHLCPPEGWGLMPCCNRAPFEVSLADRITTERASVTCRPICPECFTVRAVNGECGCVG